MSTVSEQINKLSSFTCTFCTRAFFKMGGKNQIFIVNIRASFPPSLVMDCTKKLKFCPVMLHFYNLGWV